MNFTIEQRHLTDQAGKPVSDDPGAVSFHTCEAENVDDAVREQLTTLKATLEKEPRNVVALTQLGNMYMDAAKYPQAAEYFERALAVREDPTVRTDLGICYKQNRQLDKAVDAFARAASESPDQWQALYNEAIVLGDLQRWGDARAVAAKLRAMRPNDPQVAQLVQAIESRTNQTGNQKPETRN